MNFDAGLVAVGFGCVADSVGVDGTVFKFDAVGDTLHIFFGDVAVAPHVIDFLLHVFGVSELRGEVAVVCEQEHAGGVAVETSDGIYAFVASAFDKVHHGETSVGVVACCYAVFGFVEQNVAFAFEGNNLAIVLNYIAVGYFRTEFGNDLAVYFHKTLLDEFVGFAARADAGVAHIFVETNLFVGVYNGHLVFDAFWARSKTFAASGEAVVVLVLAVVVISVVVETSLAVVVAVVVSALTVVVVSTLAIVVVSALAVVVSAILLLTVVVISALVIVVVSALTVIVVSALTVVSVLTVVGTCLAVEAVMVVVVGSLLTRLIGALVLLCTFALLSAFGRSVRLCSAFGRRAEVGVLRTVIIVSVVTAVVIVVGPLLAIVVRSLVVVRSLTVVWSGLIRASVVEAVVVG